MMIRPVRNRPWVHDSRLHVAHLAQLREQGERAHRASRNVLGKLTRGPAIKRVASCGKPNGTSTAPFNGVAKERSGPGIYSSLTADEELNENTALSLAACPCAFFQRQKEAQ